MVGANGGGKTTQLKVLAGELEPTSGDVVLSSEGVKIAYLKQEFSESLDPSKTLREELASVFVKEAELLKELSEAEDALAKGEDGALEKFEELQQKAQDGDALNIEARSRRPVVWRRLHFLNTTRVHLTMKWVVSLPNLRPFGDRDAPRRPL